MSKSCYLWFLLIGSNIVTIAASSKILFVAHLAGGRSHFNVFEPIIEELAHRNHDITVQSFFPIAHPRENIKLLELRPLILVDKLKWSIEDELSKGAICRLRGIPPFAALNCDHYLTDDTTKALVEKGKQFDLVVVDALFSECALAVAAMIGKNIMYLYTSGLIPWLPTAVTHPPSYVPSSLKTFGSKMSFLQRMQNGIDWPGVQYVSYYEILTVQQTTLTEHLPVAPTILEAREQVAFHLTNTDPVLQSPRPSMPNIAHCGGMHLGLEAKPLPKDLNDFVESSGDNGFIIFGLGSNIQADMLKPEFIDSILSALSRVKQNVVWKLDAKLENLPKNVKIVKWMPQQDLLGHPKARLFITHAGLLSLQEAVYYGVPVIAMPLFAEQPMNGARIEEIGIGERIGFIDLNGEELYQLITKVINDPKYKENMKKYSAIFKDQPERPVDRAAFWIEYVIRHDGAKHLRSAAEDLNFFQYFLLDVVALVLVLTVSGLGIIVYATKLVFKKFICSKNKKAIEKKMK